LQARKLGDAQKNMPLRFGVIGTAHWARKVHIPGLLEAGANVVGVWGRTPATVERVAQESGVAAFTSLDRLFDACDAVTMAVPPEIQAAIALRAAEAGKHLILEKPVTRDVESAHRIARAVSERDLATQVFFVRRFIPEIAAAIALEKDNAWTRANIRVHASVMATKSPYSDSVWRQAPGAALWDISPHALSVLIPMMGNVTGIHAYPERDGVSVFRTWHERGGVADVSVTLHCAADAVANDYRFFGPTRELLLPNPEFSRSGAFGRMVRELADAVRTGHRDRPCGLPLGVTIVEWLVKAELSQQRNEKVI
jgi:predicted dehydrogenase